MLSKMLLYSSQLYVMLVFLYDDILMLWICLKMFDGIWLWNDVKDYMIMKERKRDVYCMRKWNVFEGV